MVHALLTFAAQAGAESSKMPFYVAGGLLALWAVAVSFVGIRRHENWPGSEGISRGLMGISVVLVAFAMATAVITA